MNYTNSSDTHPTMSYNLHRDNILYLTATIGSLVLIGTIFYFCAKKIYLQKKTPSETNHFVAFYCNPHIPTVTVYNQQSYTIPLNRLNTINYADVPPSYDNSVKDVPYVSNNRDMPPSYEEALINGKLS
ncbi:hypothetical protein ILUMI_04496 [Ignelater luminosus]|uniref:Uncharacterized protein n=1 Tax=Ignelater luminosus TaxID=2038154 RepID=A0A8K0DEC8_IGNLU|nr:hypothetical protein ILUMI_04496 [Ignelater luminosus]